MKRDHYRGEKIALWLDLLPHINEENTRNVAKPDSAEHNLDHPKNMSTFDEPSRLITHFRRTGPPLVYVPPITTPRQNDGIYSGNYLNASFVTPQSPLLKGTTPVDDSVVSSDANPVSGSSNQKSVAKNSVPLSITVAIGCTLLFFNILIFAGVYYQRERIKKLKKADQDSGPRQANKANHIDDNASNKNENIDYMSNQQQNQNQVTCAKGVNNMDTTVLYSSICKSAEYPAYKYSYSPVPTNSSSPIHRHQNHQQHHQSNSILSISASGGHAHGSSPGRPPDICDTRSDNIINKQEKLNHSRVSNTATTNNAITIV